MVTGVSGLSSISVAPTTFSFLPRLFLGKSAITCDTCDTLEGLSWCGFLRCGHRRNTIGYVMLTITWTPCKCAACFEIRAEKEHKYFINLHPKNNLGVCVNRETSGPMACCWSIFRTCQEVRTFGGSPLIQCTPIGPISHREAPRRVAWPAGTPAYRTV